MEQVQINELKNSYYEYIAKIPQGLQTIINLLVNNELEKVFNSIADLAEGIEFLLKVEQAFKEQGIFTNSRIAEAITIFKNLNDSLANEDFILLKDLVEYELIPIFSSASEWVFQEEVK
ncbi:hypothetical protein MHH70_08230 [Metasolibacillus sp. FSL H7-0170]|uniref:hypothetical protein n=1 Tax=Metasolibacillus sp. FSL H7-0170 TaxID=2921431 RepID=UPI003157FFF9